MRALLVVLAAALTAGQLPGQVLRPNGGASLVWTRVQSQVPAGAEDFAGNVFLGQGAVGLGRLQLSVSYLQGTLNRDGAFGASRDLVEGTVMLGARPLTWLTLDGGRERAGAVRSRPGRRGRDGAPPGAVAARGQGRVPDRPCGAGRRNEAGDR